MENNNMNKNKIMSSNVVETNNGEIKTKINKSNQNNINKTKNINSTNKVVKSSKNKKKDKVKKQEIPFEEKFKPEYKITAHDGIESLSLAQTTPRTPRDIMKSFYNKGISEFKDVKFFVKGYLPNSDNKMITVINVNTSSSLLSNHCNIKVKDNPELVNSIGKLVIADIKIYPYGDNDKFSFDIIEIIDVETPEWYQGIDYNIKLENILIYDTIELNERINSLINATDSYKIRVFNDIVRLLESMGEWFYDNPPLIINQILDTLFMSTGVDKTTLTDSNFVDKYFYDLIMVFVRVAIKISETKTRMFINIIHIIDLTVDVYLNTPAMNEGKYTDDYKNACRYLNISDKQARFYNMIKNDKFYKINDIEPDFRKKFIEEMRKDVLRYCVTV